MRSEDEEDDEEYDEDNLDEEEDQEDHVPNSEAVYDEDEDAEGEGEGEGDEDDAEGDDDEDEDEDGDGDEQEDDDEDDGEDVERDGDEDEDEDEDARGDEDEVEDDDGDIDADADADADGDGDVDADGEGDADGQDMDIDGDGEPIRKNSPGPLKRSRSPSSPSHPSHPLPLPPHLLRRSLLVPSYMSPSSHFDDARSNSHSSYPTPPNSLSIEAIVCIPIPSPVHSLASTACSSYLLAGSQDGHIRAYDFYASVNGQQTLTAQQKVSIGMGETVNKGGVGRGWWMNEVFDDEGDEDGEEDAEGQVDGDAVNGTKVAGPGEEGGKGDAKNQGREKAERRGRLEPVFSLAVEGDGMWCLSGSQSGSINLNTLRHSPGTHIHTLRGHTNVVSSLSLLPDEKGFISGSWDGTIKEWDLNNGEIVRSYPTHGAQISSLSLRPTALFPYSAPAAREQDQGVDASTSMDGPKLADRISVNVGQDFFAADRDRQDGEAMANLNGENTHEGSAGKVEETRDADVDMDTSNGAIEDGPKQETVRPADEPSLQPPIPQRESPKRETREGSLDDLFGDDDPDADADADGEADAEGETVPPSEIATGANTPNQTIPLGLALPGTSSSAPVKPVIVPAQPPSSPPLSTPRTAADAIPLLSPASYRDYSTDIMLTSFMDGQVMLLDRRVSEREQGGGRGLGRLMPGDKAPPWCMSACWSGDGTQILAGRRNGTIDIWDVRQTSNSRAPNILRTLKTPAESGPVSCVVAFPDGQHVATASQDNVRLWNTAEYFDQTVEESIRRAKSKPPFKIIAGHHGGIVSSMLVDPTSRFLSVASGDRGWQGESTKVVLVHEVKW